MYGLRESQALRFLPQSLRDSSLPEGAFCGVHLLSQTPIYRAEIKKHAVGRNTCSRPTILCVPFILTRPINPKFHKKNRRSIIRLFCYVFFPPHVGRALKGGEERGYCNEECRSEAY